MCDLPETVPLSDFAEITMGQSPDSTSVSTDEIGLPFLQGCAEFGPFRPSANAYCKRPVRIGRKGATLISVRAPVGAVNAADQDYCIGRGLGAFKAISGVSDDRYLRAAIQANIEFLHRRSQGSTFAAISTQDMHDFPIPKKSLSAQQKIAKILSTVDEAIEQTEALIEKTKKIKAGLMQDLFSRGVLPNGHLRPPRHQAPHLYKNSPLGWIPREWDVSGLGQFRCHDVPHIKTGPFGSSLKLEHWVEEGVPVITIGALDEGKFEETELFYISEVTAVRLAEYRLREGDVVFSRVADVGRSSVITKNESGWVMSSNLMRISLDRPKVTPKFLQLQLAYSPNVRGQIRASVSSGGREVANTEVLNRLRFVWPDKVEQEQIVFKLNKLDSFQEYHEKEVEMFSLLKSGLMQDLLSNRIAIPLDSRSSIKDTSVP